MSAKAIREATGKDIINRNLSVNTAAAKCRFATITAETNWNNLVVDQPWLKTQPLVVKPDQLIKRRGKLGLIKVNTDLKGCQAWVQERMNKDQQVGKATGKLRNFIIEPFIPHKADEEAYVCIYSHRYADTILFHHQGGVDIGDVDAKALKLEVPVGHSVTAEQILEKLLVNVVPAKQKMVATFVAALYKLYTDLHFTYLEINPLVVTADSIYILDLAAKLDATADFICRQQWGEIDYPPPFGRDAFPEEAYIADLDAKSGASLKLTILNKKGRIWTMVAGGGASVIYSDTICDYGGASELANYGEYSGAPSEQQTYEYAKTILSLMTQEKHPQGKVLITGGGIANFTNVAATFKGIVTALTEFQGKLLEHNISIYVRRAGPNYQEGLRIIRDVGKTLRIPIYVFGPETHMTAIVGMALGKKPIPKETEMEFATANFLLPGGQDKGSSSEKSSQSSSVSPSGDVGSSCPMPASSSSKTMFTNKSKAIVWGMQTRAVQGMLDFDFVCRRSEPSVACLVYPFTGDHKLKFYWGHKEVLIPVYKKMADAMTKHKEADVLVNFASLRSAYDSTLETLNFPQIRTIAIIAEGIPENMTRKLILTAKEKGVSIIGPATVGGIKPGCLKIGNTGGMMDNILHSKLYRPGSVAYVSRSGGMSNELNNIVSKATNGVYEGVAIGGDRYPGTTFMDHILRYQADPNVKMIVLLGEVGGVEEYEVCTALKNKKLTKPLVAWCIGTCAGMFNSEVQFGHAGSCANSDMETATAKNKALKDAGAVVPTTFDNLGEAIHDVYAKLVSQGVIVPQPEVPPPTVPMDYSWARELGLIRKPASFMTSICDERGQELLYAGMPISDVLKQNMGIGGVISLLWFQRSLPQYVCKFFEMCLMVTADHGPAVSGAHNTIVCARAGKDLVSSLVSGLLTIGDRFGGALDGAAKQFSEAYDSGLIPMDFVNTMRKKGQLIMGIGYPGGPRMMPPGPPFPPNVSHPRLPNFRQQQPVKRPHPEPKNPPHQLPFKQKKPNPNSPEKPLIAGRKRNLLEVQTVDNVPDTTTFSDQAVEIEYDEDDDEETREYKRKIAEQKRLREKLLQEKEERRKLAAVAKQKELEQRKVTSQNAPNPQATVSKPQRPANIESSQHQQQQQQHHHQQQQQHQQQQPSRVSVHQRIGAKPSPVRQPQPQPQPSHALPQVTFFNDQQPAAFRMVRVRTKDGSVLIKKLPINSAGQVMLQRAAVAHAPPHMEHHQPEPQQLMMPPPQHHQQPPPPPPPQHQHFYPQQVVAPQPLPYPSPATLQLQQLQQQYQYHQPQANPPQQPVYHPPPQPVQQPFYQHQPPQAMQIHNPVPVVNSKRIVLDQPQTGTPKANFQNRSKAKLLAKKLNVNNHSSVITIVPVDNNKTMTLGQRFTMQNKQVKSVQKSTQQQPKIPVQAPSLAKPNRTVINPGLKAGSSSFKTPLPAGPVTNKVVVDNLTAGTSRQQLVSMAEQVGEVKILTLDTSQKRASITFNNTVAASAFYQKFQRKMVNLSMINVSFVNE